jgi:hypothetical protein
MNASEAKSITVRNKYHTELNQIFSTIKQFAEAGANNCYSDPVKNCAVNDITTLLEEKGYKTFYTQVNASYAKIGICW